MAQQQIVDLTEGETFLKTALEIRLAIKERVSALTTEKALFMEEVKGELEGLTPAHAAALFLIVMQNENLSPKALLVRKSLERACSAQQEIDRLAHISSNLNPEQPILYKLSLDQVVKFGMITWGPK